VDGWLVASALLAAVIGFLAGFSLRRRRSSHKLTIVYENRRDED